VEANHPRSHRPRTSVLLIGAMRDPVIRNTGDQPTGYSRFRGLRRAHAKRELVHLAPPGPRGRGVLDPGSMNHLRPGSSRSASRALASPSTGNIRTAAGGAVGCSSRYRLDASRLTCTTFDAFERATTPWRAATGRLRGICLAFAPFLRDCRPYRRGSVAPSNPFVGASAREPPAWQ